MSVGPTDRANPAPRWSNAWLGTGLVPWSMAGLPAWRARVSVGPPLAASDDARFGSVLAGRLVALAVRFAPDWFRMRLNVGTIGVAASVRTSAPVAATLLDTMVLTR